jgi:hypothetical protein
MTENPKTPVEAVTLGLYLAITAPTEEKAQECVGIAEQAERNRYRNESSRHTI